MPSVKIPFDSIRWPSKCCRCGSEEHSFRTHTDDVVSRTLLSVTEYRKISLNIPVCDRCARAQVIWFGAAILSPALGLLITSLVNDPNELSLFVIVLFCLGVVFALVGVNKRPIKILKFDEKTKLLTIRIYNKQIAEQVANVAT